MFIWVIKIIIKINFILMVRNLFFIDNKRGWVLWEWRVFFRYIECLFERKYEKVIIYIIDYFF